MQIKTTLMLLAALTLTACSSGSDKTDKGPAASSGKDSAQTHTAETASDNGGYATLADAIAGNKSSMSDTDDDVSDGAVSLASWSADHMKWSELQGLPKTKAGLVMKDSDQQRGKLICASGELIEIASEKEDDKKFYEGGLQDDDDNIYRFIAVKSTGGLVENSHATLCGVVIGRQDYADSVGGEAHAVFLVGMFQLPENTKS